MAAGVGRDLGLAHRLGLQRARAFLEEEIGGVVVVDEHLERDAERLGVVEGRVVVVRDPPRAMVDVQAVVEIAGLRIAAEFGDGDAAPCGLRSAAGELASLDDLDLVPRLAEFVRRGQAGQSAAEDEDLLAAARSGQGGGSGLGGGDSVTEGLHAGHHQAGAADKTQPLDQAAAGEGGLVHASGVSERCSGRALVDCTALHGRVMRQVVGGRCLPAVAEIPGVRALDCAWRAREEAPAGARRRSDMPVTRLSARG